MCAITGAFNAILGRSIITSGAQQAFALIALTVIEPGAVAWCEDPGHIAVRDVMRLLYIA